MDTLTQTSEQKPVGLGWFMDYSLGGKLSKLRLEKFPSGSVAQDFPGHIVDLVSYKVTVLLGDFVKRTALTKETADNTVIALIASSLTTGIGVTVVNGQLFITVCVMLHALAILKLRAVIHGYCLEGALGKLRQRFTKGFHSGRSSLAKDTQDYFIAGQSLREDQKGLSLALCLAYYTIKLPMTEDSAGVYFLRALLYTSAFWRTLCFNVAVFTLFIGFFSEIFINDVRDIAFVYVTVKSGSGNGPFPLSFQSACDLVRGTALLDLVGNVFGIIMAMVELDRNALNSSLPIGIVLGYLSGISLYIFPCITVPVVIETMAYFIGNSGHRTVHFSSYKMARMTVIEKALNSQAVRPSSTMVFYRPRGLFIFLSPSHDDISFLKV